MATAAKSDLLGSKPVKMHKVGKSRRDVMRALAAYPAFKESDFEAWAVRFEHLCFMSKFTDHELDHEKFDRFCKLALGMKRGTSEFLFKCFDKDNSGGVSATEFVNAALTLCKGTLKQKLEVAYMAYDKNGDGKIDFDELYAGMMASKGLTVDDFDKDVADHVQKVLKALDKNHNGLITKDDFVKGVMADARLVEELGTWMRTSRVLTEPQYVSIKALFNDVDQDGSGKIDLHEMASFAKMCLPGKPRLAEKRAKHKLRKMDSKGYDGVDLGEWIKFFEQMYAGEKSAAVTKAISTMRDHFKVGKA
jgi:Ca2+-binding EF-hand superfamily protein